MKKIITILLALTFLSIAAMPTMAQGRDRRINNNIRTYYGTQTRTNNSQSYNDYRRRDRSFWEQHRDKLTVAGGSVGGAIIGGLIGGKKGAVIGALSGAGGSALYTYKIRDRHNRRFWR